MPQFFSYIIFKIKGLNFFSPAFIHPANLQISLELKVFAPSLFIILQILNKKRLFSQFFNCFVMLLFFDTLELINNFRNKHLIVVWLLLLHFCFVSKNVSYNETATAFRIYQFHVFLDKSFVVLALRVLGLGRVERFYHIVGV